MTRRTSEQVAGVAFIVYFAAGIASLSMLSAATKGVAVVERLGSLAASAASARATILLTLVQACCALCLAVSLYALTREVDGDIALMGFAFRVAEGVSGVAVTRTLGLLWLATAPNAATLAPSVRDGLGLSLFEMGPWQPNAAFFAFGSLLFSWLLVRGRLVASWLAWLGVIASALLVVLLPLQLSGIVDHAIAWDGPVGAVMWLPMLTFEIVIALVLLVRGLRPIASGVAQ